jgi:DnaD/phage-associated family protein
VEEISVSVSIMQKVWSNDKHSGSDLVVMLFLADKSDDNGISWHGIDSIAKHARITKRSAIRSIEKLEATGDVYVERSKGRAHTNVYVITIGRTVPELSGILANKFNYAMSQAVKIASETLKKGDISGINSDAHVTFTEDIKGDIFDIKGDAHVIKGDIFGKEKVTPTSPKTSYKPKETKGTTTSGFNFENEKQAENEIDEAWQKVVNAYESNIGVFTAMSSEIVRSAVDDYGSIFVVDAIKAAVLQNVRKWSYVDGILKRWKANGRPETKPVMADKPKIKSVTFYNQYTNKMETKVI